MHRTRMVHLTSATSTFQARVIAARLGSDGVLTQLRGAVDGPYPFGEVRVYVPEDEFDTARQILLVEEVEAAFEGDHDPPPRRLPRWVIVVTVAVAAAVGAGGAFAAR